MLATQIFEKSNVENCWEFFDVGFHSNNRDNKCCFDLVCVICLALVKTRRSVPNHKMLHDLKNKINPNT